MNTPLLIEETSLSEAWCNTLDYILSHKGREITPLVLTLTDFDESLAVKQILDAHLKANKLNSIDKVSNTIFPNQLYQILDGDRSALYQSYMDSVPRIRAIDKRNSGGTYFERLIAFGGQKNQLEIIINSINKKDKRRSKLQASTFDPLKDHKNEPFQGFPCLQHVTFYKSSTGGLILNSFYAMQYLYQKAYGNWLGLINLGKFVASETGLTFERLTCFVGVEKLEDDINITQARALLKEMNEVR